MKYHFYKYQGTGNDFVILDNRDGKIQLTQEQIINPNFALHRKQSRIIQK